MSRVVFYLTDVQVSALVALAKGESVAGQDPRIFTALEKRGLVVNKDSGSYYSNTWALTGAGKLAIALCERLAILGGQKTA